MSDRKTPCLGCGEPTSYGIPYTICSHCRKTIENYMKARKGLSNAFRKTHGIKQFRLKGKDDNTLNLNFAYEHIAEIEEKIEWLKNCLRNIKVMA